MLSNQRKLTRATGVLGPISRLLIAGLTLTVAGCSADVTRFGLNTSNTTSSIPVPPEPIGNRYGPSAAPRGLGLTETPLPPPEPTRMTGRDYDQPPPLADRSSAPYSPPALAERTPPPRQDDYAQPQGNYRVIGRKYKTSPPQASQPSSERAPEWQASPRVGGPTQHREAHQEATGNTIDVQPGETLYSIGRRTNTSPAAIKDANGLTSDALRPGQRLVIPGGAQTNDRAPVGRTTMLADERGPPSAFPRNPAGVTSTPPVEAPPGWEGRYTMRNGDSLNGVAIRYRVSLEDLKRANGISDPTKVWAGTVLNVPGEREPTASLAPNAATQPPRVAQTPPRIINAVPAEPPLEQRAPEAKIASRGDIANDAEPPQTALTKFSWPVRGKMLAGFGRRPDGTHNDGVNLGVAQGTEIRAAEAGKVAYAGNELKGYGNLVLIRHANGYVTAYAHADQLLVRPNDEVRRGQVIAKAGKTGAVDQPQVHFELRQGSRPIDPTPHMAN